MDGIPNIGFLFDLDGVLIDSEEEYTRIWREINQIFPTGIEKFEEKIKGTTLTNILTQYYPDKQIQKEVTAMLLDLEAKMNYAYKEGAEELLDEIRENGFPLALVTSSNDAKMNHLKEEIPDLCDKFHFIVTSDLINKSKPDPEGYLLAASMLDCCASDCYVFEDSLQGVKAGKNAGAHVIGISGTLAPEVLEPFSDVVINTLTDFHLESVLGYMVDR